MAVVARPAKNFSENDKTVSYNLPRWELWRGVVDLSQ